MIHGISPKSDNSSFAMGTPGFLAYAFLAQLLKEETDEFWIRLFSVFSKLMFQELCCRRDYLRQSMNIHAIELAAGDIQSGKTERSEEHTSDLQSLMRISYAVFCLKQTKKHT